MLSNDYILRGSIKNPDKLSKFVIRWRTTIVDNCYKVFLKMIISREFYQLMERFKLDIGPPCGAFHIPDKECSNFVDHYTRDLLRSGET